MSGAPGLSFHPSGPEDHSVEHAVQVSTLDGSASPDVPVRVSPGRAATAALSLRYTSGSVSAAGRHHHGRNGVHRRPLGSPRSYCRRIRPAVGRVVGMAASPRALRRAIPHLPASSFHRRGQRSHSAHVGARATRTGPRGVGGSPSPAPIMVSLRQPFSVPRHPSPGDPCP